MSTLQQIEANRLNAQKSTGPRSAAGKAASSANALKTGIDALSVIIPGEDAAELEALTAWYTEHFQPATPAESFQVDNLVRDDWQLRRLAKVDAQIWKHEMSTLLRLNEDAPLGHTHRYADRSFDRLQRRISATRRAYKASLQDLLRLQAARPAPEPDPAQPVAAPPVQPLADPPSSSPIGFVPPLSPAAPVSPPLPKPQNQNIRPGPLDRYILPRADA